MPFKNANKFKTNNNRCYRAFNILPIVGSTVTRDNNNNNKTTMATTNAEVCAHIKIKNEESNALKRPFYSPAFTHSRIYLFIRMYGSHLQHSRLCFFFFFLLNKQKRQICRE